MLPERGRQTQRLTPSQCGRRWLSIPSIDKFKLPRGGINLHINASCFHFIALECRFLRLQRLDERLIPEVPLARIPDRQQCPLHEDALN